VRIHKDLKLMHQMYHGETKMNFDDYFEVVTDTRTRLGTIKAIKQTNSKLNIQRHSFCSRQVARWNNIPLEMRESDQESFKEYMQHNL
jgi:hypothetical protein